VKLSDASYHELINLYFVQINYTGAGNRTTSDAAIPIKPNSSIRFTGRTDVLAKLKGHFTAKSNDELRRRKFFLLYGMGGIGKTQICLRFIEDMSD
jgi:Holliday junction resolvasome RuvABC ATP-dependent DNA helicase subunit